MDRSYFKYVFIAAVVIIIVFAIYKVNSNSKKDDGNVDQTSTVNTIQKDLRFSIAGLDTLNPIISKNRNVQEITKIIYEPLLTLNENYKIEYRLAESIYKQDDLNYEITLRKGVLWTDGNPFTAEDVKFTVDSIKNAGNMGFSSIYQENLKYVTALEVLDENRVKMTLSLPVSFFEYNLTFPIMSSKYYEGVNILDGDKNAAPVGTGQFKISNINGNVYTLDRNNEYWDKSRIPMAEQVIITNYATMGEVYNSFKSGDIDLVTVTVNNVENYVGTIGYNKVEYKGRNYDFLCINTQSSVLQDKEIRKAISYAIDRNSIVATCLGSGYISSNFPMDMGSWLYTRDLNTGADTEMAKQVLTNDGWNYRNNSWQKKIDNRTENLSFSITVNSNDEQRVRVAENIANQLSNIGIAVSIRELKPDRYINALADSDFDCIITGLEVGFSPSLTTLFGIGNIAKYENEEMVNLLIQANATEDEKQLENIYNRIFEIYMEDCPSIGLYRNTQFILMNPGLVCNLTANCYNIYHNIDKWYRQ